MQVNDRVALVTGANRGIGKAIVEALLAHGAKKVYAAVRTPPSAQELVAASGGKVVAIALDLSQPQSILAAAKQAQDVEVVINNAGVLRTTGALDPQAADSLQFELDINVYGLLRMAQAFAPVLKANGGGAFVQLNSVVSIKNFPNFATYSTSKAAAYSLTQALRADLAAQGTQVMSVHPGPIATDMGDAAGLSAIAEPPSIVAEALIAGLSAGQFHVFPDTMAKQFWGAYQSYATSMVEAELSEG
jgi:NAD(P)-dependent dehydrogenase (short-subunit alcohol dehydrogenase family)